MVRMRPVIGSVTTIAPFIGPSASTAARRTVRSSPSMKSPSVESAKFGTRHGPLNTVFLDRALGETTCSVAAFAASGLAECVDFFFFAEVTARRLEAQTTEKRTSTLRISTEYRFLGAKASP